MEANNSIVLSDDQESTQAMCHILMRHLAFAHTLPSERLPYRVPLMFYGGQMHVHPFHVPGSFDYVKKVDDAGVVVIPYGNDDEGNQIVDPPVLQPPAISAPPAIPALTTASGSAPGTGTGSSLDSSAALLHGVLQAMQYMTQVNVQSDMRNASIVSAAGKTPSRYTSISSSSAQELDS